MSNLRGVDFFCGAGGMSYGLREAGISVLAGVDSDSTCKATYTANVLGAKFIKHDITSLSAPELGRRLQLNKEDGELIFAGCCPCQYWSKIRTDKSKSEKSAFLLKNFERFIHYFLPGFIVVENVPGLRTRTKESILPQFLSFLERNDYVYDHNIVNANDYGVPQNRIRYLLIASRVVKNVSLPPAQKDPELIVKKYLGTSNGFSTIPAGHRDTSEFLHSAAGLSLKNLERIEVTPKSGGSRMSWKDDQNLQIPAYLGRDSIFRDVYARMYWEKPAPTITTRFTSFSNGRFGHPEENRAISIREGATLQTFPKTFKFKETNQSILARHIGNAVPPEMARRIGLHILGLSKNG